VDTGALDSDSGDTDLGDPGSPNQGEPPVTRHHTNAVITERSIPKTYTKAINNPIYGAY
jgi:hypothetical protein